MDELLKIQTERLIGIIQQPLPVNQSSPEGSVQTMVLATQKALAGECLMGLVAIGRKYGAMTEAEMFETVDKANKKTKTA